MGKEASNKKSSGAKRHQKQKKISTACQLRGAHIKRLGRSVGALSMKKDAVEHFKLAFSSDMDRLASRVVLATKHGKRTTVGPSDVFFADQPHASMRRTRDFSVTKKRKPKAKKDDEGKEAKEEKKPKKGSSKGSQKPKKKDDSAKGSKKGSKKGSQKGSKKASEADEALAASAPAPSDGDVSEAVEKKASERRRSRSRSREPTGSVPKSSSSTTPMETVLEESESVSAKAATTLLSSGDSE